MAELYTLPDGWEWKKLGDIGKISTGKTPPKVNKEFYENGTIRFIKPPNLQNSYNIQKAESDEFVTEDGAKKSTLLPKNTLMVCCIGSLGKFALSNEKVITNQQINSIIFYDDIINYKYGYYYGFKLEKLLNEVANEAVVKIVNKTIFSNLNIPLPPLEEQKRIVAKLDILFAKIDKAIALHQKNIDEANVFMASVLNDVFGELEEKYEKFNINKIATVKGGKRVPKGYTLSEEVTPYPYLRVTDFKDYGTICTKKMLYLTEEVHEQIKRYTITDEDLYITNVGNTIGKSGIIPSELNGANLTENAVKLVYKDKKNTSNKFMYYFTKTSIFLIQLESATMQMAVPKLAIMRLGEIELPFPPIETQQKVVSYLDEISQKIEKIKQIQKEKMQSLKELKASILDQAFRGEL